MEEIIDHEAGMVLKDWCVKIGEGAKEISFPDDWAFSIIHVHLWKSLDPSRCAYRNLRCIFYIK